MVETTTAAEHAPRSTGGSDPHALSIGRILRETGVAFRRSALPILVLALACFWAPQHYFGNWPQFEPFSLHYGAIAALILLKQLAIVAVAGLGQSAILTLALSAMDGEPIRPSLADVRWAAQRTLRAWPPLLAFYLVTSLARFIAPLPLAFAGLFSSPFDPRPLQAILYATQAFALLLTVWIGVYPPAVVAERRPVFRGVIRADILLSGRRGRFILVLLLLGGPALLPGPLLTELLARRLTPPELPLDLLENGARLLTPALAALWTVGLAAIYRECRRQREGPGAEVQARVFD